MHEIYTVGPHFKEASNFLWPFKLSSACEYMTKRTDHAIDVHVDKPRMCLFFADLIPLCGFSGRHGQEAQALCGGRPSRKQGGPDQQAHCANELNLANVVYLGTSL